METNNYKKRQEIVDELEQRGFPEDWITSRVSRVDEIIRRGSKLGYDNLGYSLIQNTRELFGKELWRKFDVDVFIPEGVPIGDRIEIEQPGLDKATKKALAEKRKK